MGITEANSEYTHIRPFIKEPLWALKSAPTTALVRMSARCFLVETYLTESAFSLTNFRMKWNLTSMSLVLADASGLVTKAIASSLPANTLKNFSERDGTMKDNTGFTNKPPVAMYSA